MTLGYPSVGVLSPSHALGVTKPATSRLTLRLVARCFVFVLLLALLRATLVHVTLLLLLLAAAFGPAAPL